MNRIALVTGTSTGIGLSTAIHLAKAGFKVVATMRNLAKAGPLKERAQKENVALDLRVLDVESDASVAGCVRDVLATHGQIDVLVNNAGQGYLGSMEQTSQEQLRKTMEINFFGVWRTTQAVFPHLREKRSGRVITVSSIGGLIGQPFNDAYCAAKFACEGYFESLAPVAKRLGIHLSLVEPGPVATEFVNTVLGQRKETQGVDAAYQPLLDGYMRGSQEAFKISQTGDDIARVIVEAATAEAPHLRYVTSEWVRGLASRKYTDPTGDSIIALTGSRLS